ncbi:MAG: hypothetical protein IPG88_20765 [Gemmatimonadetes bacterium]|nr:hypothetical protein [Gemmatimonadota bacterium]
MVRSEIMRGRWRDGFDKPRRWPGRHDDHPADAAGRAPHTKKGHRIMVRVQSSMFPVFDRNPQTHVPNIFKADDKDFPQGDADRPSQQQHRSAGAEARRGAMSGPKAPAAGDGQARESIEALAARFLAAAARRRCRRREGDAEATPAIARYDIHTAAAIGDAAARCGRSSRPTARAGQRLPGDDVEPLLYAVHDDLKRALGVSEEAQLATVRALLDAGADANASAPLPDVSNSIPALYFPCVRGNVAVARLLLEHGANPTDGESLYHAAQHDHRECLELSSPLAPT